MSAVRPQDPRHRRDPRRRQAPAFAQKHPHWLRWLDFIPESYNRRRISSARCPMPETALARRSSSRRSTPTTASRASRPPSSRPRRDSFNFQYNWPHLYQNAVIDVSDIAGVVSKARASSTEVCGAVLPGQRQWPRCRTRIVGNAVATGKSWLKKPGRARFRRPGTKLARSSRAE